jgi:hypothetical protein
VLRASAHNVQMNALEHVQLLSVQVQRCKLGMQLGMRANNTALRYVALSCAVSNGAMCCSTCGRAGEVFQTILIEQKRVFT